MPTNYNHIYVCVNISILLIRLAYRTFDTDKGGNPALMAPEVAAALPGTFTNINYTKVTEQNISNITLHYQFT